MPQWARRSASRAIPWTGAEQRDASDNLTGSFGESETAVLAGAGWRITGRLALGAMAEYIGQSLDGDSESAFDLGAGAVMAMDGYNIGFSARNIMENSLARAGGEDKLPRTMRFGMSARPLKDLLVEADGVMQHGGGTQPNVGAEYRPLYWTALRAGYDGNFGTLGAGFSYGPVTLDYAIVKQSDLGFSQRVTLRYSFGLPDS